MIVMPTMRRPEMLALSLESIRKADHYDEDVRIFADTGTDLSELEHVRDNYFPEAEIFQARPHPKATSGTWNILNAIKHGAKMSKDIVFLIEEDVLVGRDYFDWTRKVHEDFEISSGRAHPVSAYTNPGAGFSPSFLKFFCSNINPAFFVNPKQYMDIMFPGTTDGSVHDDGLIRRFIKFNSLDVAVPGQPKVAHIGFQAYRRYDRWLNDGDIETRIARLRNMVAQPSDRFTSDLEHLG